MATFLLGAWLGCSIFMAFMVVENLRFPGQVMNSPSGPAREMLAKLGREDAALLLRYQAAEQNRAYMAAWELAQFAVALGLAAFLFLGTQKKLLPMLLCGIMLVLVGVEHFVISPELAFRGREADFPPGNRTFATEARVWAMEQAYIGLEGAKLLIGGILGSYLFVFRAGSRRGRKQVYAVDYADHSHVDG
jgi:hypothetical protein